MKEGEIHIGGNFPVKGAECRHYCNPTCHPAQIGDGWVYGCLHAAWPQNKYDDFCPIVQCGGEISKCEILEKLIRRMMAGWKQRVKNACTKIEGFEQEIEELEELLGGQCGKP